LKEEDWFLRRMKTPVAGEIEGSNIFDAACRIASRINL
jgi:hypothetical protein